MIEEKKISAVQVESPKRIKMELSKRIDRYGQPVVNRKLLHSSLHDPFTPDYNLIGTPLQQIPKELAKSFVQGEFFFESIVSETAEEKVLRPIQEQAYGNLYVFSDEGETMDDLDKRYKPLGSGFKSFNKQRKKLNNDRVGFFDP